MVCFVCLDGLVVEVVYVGEYYGYVVFVGGGDYFGVVY